MAGTASGLAKARRLSDNRGQRARELREEGRKVVGYFCCYPPAEMLTALDLVPYRIQGNVDRPVEAADTYLETVCCSFVRSCFDLALTGDYDFLDGIIVPHTCDTVQRIYDHWRCHCKPALAHFLDVPHMMQPSSFVFFKHELRRMQSALEDLAGKKLEVSALRKSIALHNEHRALLREFYALRKADPPPVSGSEAHELLIAGMGLPVGEHNDLVREVLAEVSARPRRSGDRRPRLLIWGNELDSTAFFRAVEECGAEIVVDDVCTGTRSFWPEVPLTDDPLDGLSMRYLGGINCPRTYRPQVLPRAADLQNRFGYLLSFARDFRVDGIIMYVIRFCDTHELDAPDVVDFCREHAIPTLHLEEEYRVANVGQIKTRVQAFLETLG